MAVQGWPASSQHRDPRAALARKVHAPEEVRVLDARSGRLEMALVSMRFRTPALDLQRFAGVLAGSTGTSVSLDRTMADHATVRCRWIAGTAELLLDDTGVTVEIMPPASAYFMGAALGARFTTFRRGDYAAIAGAVKRSGPSGLTGGAALITGVRGALGGAVPVRPKAYWAEGKVGLD